MKTQTNNFNCYIFIVLKHCISKTLLFSYYKECFFFQNTNTVYKYYKKSYLEFHYIHIFKKRPTFNLHKGLQFLPRHSKKKKKEETMDVQINNDYYFFFKKKTSLQKRHHQLLTQYITNKYSKNFHR